MTPPASSGFLNPHVAHVSFAKCGKKTKQVPRHKTGVVIGVWALFGQRILVPRLLSISPADSDAAPLFARRTEWGGTRETR